MSLEQKGRPCHGQEIGEDDLEQAVIDLNQLVADLLLEAPLDRPDDQLWTIHDRARGIVQRLEKVMSGESPIVERL